MQYVGVEMRAHDLFTQPLSPIKHTPSLAVVRRELVNVYHTDNTSNNGMFIFFIRSRFRVIRSINLYKIISI